MSSFGAFGGGSFGTFGPGDGGNSGGFNQQTGFGDFMNFIQPDGAPAAPPPGYTYNPATGMNEMYVPSRGVMAGTGITYSRAPEESFGAGGMGQFQAAAMQDYMNLVNANQMNYDISQGAISDYRNEVMGQSENILAGGEEMFNFLTGEADSLSALGQSVTDEMRGKADTIRDEFKDTRGESISSGTYGLQRRAQNRSMEIDALAKTDPQAAAAARGQLELDMSSAIGDMAMKESANYNNALANVNQAVAGIYGQAAGTQLAYEQQSNAMSQAAVSVMETARMNSANMAAQGLYNVAQMHEQNEFNPVSFLDVITSYFAFGMTSGSGSYPGIEDQFMDVMQA